MSDENSKGFVTKGSVEYFAERETKINARITEAKSKIDEIETKVRSEISEISAIRDRIQEHLSGFIQARNEMVQHREKTISLIENLNSVVAICDADLPSLDKMLDDLERDYTHEDNRLADAEKSRHRQLHKHERAKTRYELRSTRLTMRKKLMLGEAAIDAAIVDVEKQLAEAKKSDELFPLETPFPGGPEDFRGEDFPSETP